MFTHLYLSFSACRVTSIFRPSSLLKGHFTSREKLKLIWTEPTTGGFNQGCQELNHRHWYRVFSNNGRWITLSIYMGYLNQDCSTYCVCFYILDYFFSHITELSPMWQPVIKPSWRVQAENWKNYWQVNSVEMYSRTQPNMQRKINMKKSVRQLKLRWIN